MSSKFINFVSLLMVADKTSFESILRRNTFDERNFFNIRFFK